MVNPTFALYYATANRFVDLSSGSFAWAVHVLEETAEDGDRFAQDSAHKTLYAHRDL
jgi:hypothetical protein